MDQIKLLYTGLNFTLENENDIDYLKKLNINLSQLKVINIRACGAFYQNFDYFYKTFFGFIELQNYLIELNIN